jgi:hypothetical protein
MATASQALPLLCDICDAIDFTSYFLPPCPEDECAWNDTGEVTYREIILGVCTELSDRSARCAFCELAYLALDTKRKRTPDDAVVTMSSFCYAKTDAGSKTHEKSAHCIRVMAKVGRSQLRGHIRLLANDGQRLGIPTEFLARVPEQERFDMKQACKWLEICRKNPTNRCSVPTSQPRDLLAIDLDEMCICLMSPGSDFAALSYCWPATPHLTLTCANREELFQSGALRRLRDKLPRTIQDALDCATELPFRYLWIDALCIIQDDIDHKIEQLRQMDRVYSCAALTIVCAYPVARDTPDACAGLPLFRTRHGADSQRHVAAVKGLHMMVASPCAYSTLDETRWSTRCWTFQEQHLSPRLLYFTPTQVYYECACSSFCEDVAWESINQSVYMAPGSTLWSTKVLYKTDDPRKNWGEWHLSRAPLPSAPDMWHSYDMALSTYTSRQVTYSSDMLKAFEGVRGVLSEAMQTDFWQGIPENILSLALCWQLSGRFRRRETELDGETPSSMLFPSWSWAGWDTPVDLSTFIPICACKNEAEWYIMNGKAVATRLRTQPDDIREAADPAETEHDDTRSHETSPFESISMQHISPRVVPRSEVNATSPDWRDARALWCWTTRASFQLDGTKHIVSADRHERMWPRSHVFAIKDVQGKTAGCILLPKRFLKQHRVRSMVCEFIAISKSLPQRYWEKPKEMRYYDDDVYGPADGRESWVVNAMMIDRSGDNEARRIAVGVIHEDAWSSATPETTLVKLV